MRCARVMAPCTRIDYRAADLHVAIGFVVEVDPKPHIPVIDGATGTLSAVGQIAQVCLGSVRPPADVTDPHPRLARAPDNGDSCAIGRIISFEPPSSKSFPDNIDNDFSFQHPPTTQS